ncbi:MAG TPA: hypothetical protein VKB96_10800 [Gammaproteobacteria bacterium]|nr:hypothetical protein [Gammaproteobacteria bacterium]
MTARVLAQNVCGEIVPGDKQYFFTQQVDDNVPALVAFQYRPHPMAEDRTEIKAKRAREKSAERPTHQPYNVERICHRGSLHINENLAPAN